MTIEIHPTAIISRFADIEPSVKGTKIVIGARTVIDSFVKIKPAGGCGDIVIGSDCVLNSGCVVYSGNGVYVSNNVSIAANTVIAPVNHEYKKKELSIKEQRFRVSKGGVVIEEDVWIGAACVLLDGSILRKGCVVGAMSLVRSEIAAYSVNVGNPLRNIGWRE